MIFGRTDLIGLILVGILNTEMDIYLVASQFIIKATVCWAGKNINGILWTVLIKIDNY